MTGRLKAMATALAALATLLLAACGGEEQKAQPQQEGKRGGTLKVLADGDVDNIDPGIAYYQFTYMFMFASQRGLYGWTPEDTTQPTPDLADGLPQSSPDGRTVTVKIKPGIKYSPPVNREVAARDVKYAIERGFTDNVANGYANAYFGAIRGAKEFSDGKADEIVGIEAPDDRTLVFRLDNPVGVISVPNALALPLTVPVPKEYAQKFDKDNPSTYGQHQVFTGPYMIENDSSGKLTGYQPGKRIVLVRNPNWNQATDYRPALLDRIEVQEGVDTTVASRQILNGRDAINGDFGAPPPAELKRALQTKKEQVAFVPSGGNRYIAINTTIKPFDDVNVRRAVLAATDRDALRLTRGGESIGPIATHFLPPGFPGFEEAGGLEGPGYDFLRNPKGDMALAAEYMRKAGYSSGKYEGNEEFLMVGDREEPGSKTAEVAQAQFEKLGFKVTLRQVPHDTMYSKFCNVPKAKVAICPNVGWLKDFNDGQSMLDPTFNGENINPVNNSNWAQLNDPEVNAAIDAAKAVTDPARRVKAWAEVDKQVTGLAPAIPWVWDQNVNIRSANVNGVTNKFNGTWDLAYTSLK